MACFMKHLQSLLAEIETKKEEATELVVRKKKVSAALGEKQPSVEEQNIFSDQVCRMYVKQTSF